MVNYTEVIQATDNNRKFNYAVVEYAKSGFKVSQIGPEKYSGKPEPEAPVIPTSWDKTEKVITAIHYDAVGVGVDNQTIVNGNEMLRPDRDAKFSGSEEERSEAVANLFEQALGLYTHVDQLGNEVIFKSSWSIRSADGEIDTVAAIEIYALIDSIHEDEIRAAFEVKDDQELPPAASCGPIVDIASLITKKKGELVKVLAIRNLDNDKEDWIPLDIDKRAYLVEMFIRKCVLPHFWLKWIINGKMSRTILKSNEGGEYSQSLLPLKTLNQIIFNRKNT